MLANANRNNTLFSSQGNRGCGRNSFNRGRGRNFNNNSDWEIIQVEMQVLQVVLIITTILHQVSPTIKDLHAKSVVRMVMQPWIVTTVWTTHTKANNLLLSLLRWLLHQTHSTQINPIGSLTHEQPITLLLICQPYLIIKSILALILLLLVMVKQFLPLI